ncbi:MAG: hypothetical protein QOE70_6348 [Chthoniobacter sp.]|jgi:hypothetical protein|nr:hypothetical protein [Chthoniobacter sp.]
MKSISLLLLLVVLAAPGMAQTPAATPAPTANQTVIPLFRAKLPGGNYEVAIRAIVAVTSHEYLVDGVARVTEVNIDTTGSLLARFYYIEPTTPNTPLGIGNAAIEQTQRLLKEAADKTGQDVWKKVVKNYPTTTHARTVEYRVQSLEQLNKLYESAEQAFRLQRDTRITVADE